MGWFDTNKITETSEEQVINSIVQISNAQCLNVCINGAAITTIVNNSSGVDIDIKESCIISGTSCVIKAALDATILNSLSNLQKAAVSDEEDPTNLLNSILGDTGNTNNINMSNYQTIVNQITQELNSICENKAVNAGKPINIILSGVKNYKEHIDQGEKVSNTNCNISNLAKVYMKNSETNTQTASIVRTGMFGGLGFLLILIALFMFMKHKKKKHQQFSKLYKTSKKK